MMLLLCLFVLLCTVPSVLSSSIAEPSRADEIESSHLIHPQTVRVQMTATKYWQMNHRKEHIEGMQLDVIDAPLQGCPAQDFNIPCTVGGQSFNCQVDTGSTSLGIATTACTACGGVKAFYNPATSGTLLSTGDLTSRFGDGASWTGNGYRDVAAVDGSTAASMVLVGITTQSMFFPAYDTCNFGSVPLKYSAIMGFAGPGIGVTNGNGVRAQPWFQQYVAATGAPALFTLRMCLDTGDLWISGYNNSTFTDQIHWVNVQQLGNFAPGQAFYTIALQCIGIVGGNSDCNSGDFQNGVNSIVDSGTTEAIIPAAAYNDILSFLDANFAAQFKLWFGTPTASAYFAGGNCIAPTTSNVTIAYMNSILPKVTITIGGSDSGAPLIMTLNGVNFYLMQVISNQKTFFCPGIQSNANTIGTGTVILGWSFINQFIVAHDLSKNKIGFAPRLGCGDASAGGGAINNVVGGDVNVLDATGSLGISATGANPGNQGTIPSSSNKTAIIIGVVVAVVVVAAIAIGGYVYYKRQQGQQGTMEGMQKQQQWAAPAQQQQQQWPQQQQYGTAAAAPPPAYGV